MNRTNFTYPPQNSNLQFDYRDSVVTSWVTRDAHATQGVLSLWYWLLNGQINWTVSMSAHITSLRYQNSPSKSCIQSSQHGELTNLFLIPQV